MKVYRAGKLVLTKDNVTSGAYTDENAAAGKNTYEVRAYQKSSGKYGKAAKKTVNILGETWMEAPVVRKAVQLDTKTAKISFSHISPAESYVIAGAGKTQTVAFSKLARDPETGWFSCEVPLKGTGKKKITVQPLKKNEKEKTVKGKKSAAFKMISLKETLLGATDVTAAADGDGVIVSWKNPNGNRIESNNFRIYLFNKSTKKAVKGTMEADWKNARATVKGVNNGTYKVFVRILTEDNDDIADEKLYDLVNLEMPEVKVTGIALDDLKLTLSKTSVTLYEQTSATTTLTATNKAGTAVAWTSSDPSVATVSNAGKVTAKRGGICYITAQADGGPAVSCKVTVNPAVYRAVVIAETSKSKSDPGIRFNNDRLYLEGMLKGAGYSTVKTAVDISKVQALDLIKETFKDADQNDVSLVFFSCHGVTSYEYTYVSGYGLYDYSGDLCFTKGENLTPLELAVRLDEDIPAGRVAVFLGSCGSGAMIETNGPTDRETGEPWGQAFIDAVAQLDSGSDEDLEARFNELSAIGETSTTKTYYVMAAAEQYKTSSGPAGSAAHTYNYFATWVGESAGYVRNGKRIITVVGDHAKVSYMAGKSSTGKWAADMPGDTNKKDGQISFQECYSYLRDQKENTVDGYIATDNPLKYSSGADFPLFRR